MSTDILPAAVPAPSTAAPMRFRAGGGMAIETFEQAWRMAQLFSRSELVPKDYREKPENCLVAMQMGAELGLPPLQALQGIAVINGRPSVWGDALWALVQSSPLVEDAKETFDEATSTATCSIKRRGRSGPTVQSFSQKDAALAGLWDKSGPWKTNPRRMLQMRARAFAARDALPDVLKGLAIAEEALDIPPDAPLPAEPPRTGTAALRTAAEKAAQTAPSGQGEAQEPEARVAPAEGGSPEGADEAQRIADYVAILDEATSPRELDDLAKQAPSDLWEHRDYLTAVERRRETLKARKSGKPE